MKIVITVSLCNDLGTAITTQKLILNTYQQRKTLFSFYKKVGYFRYMCQNQDNLGQFLVIFKFQDILRFQNFLGALNVPMSVICYLPLKDIIEISFFQLLCCRTGTFKNSFLPDTINDWNRLDPKIRKIDLGFWKKLTFGICYPLRINRLIVGFRHLN